MKSLKLVQFHNYYSETGGDGLNCRTGRWCYLHDERDSYEYYMGENDDGDDEYEERRSLSFSDELEHAQEGNYLTYVPKDEVSYAILEFIF